MPKVILKERDSYNFQYSLKTQIHHVNYSGHVGHDAIIQMIWEARVNLLRNLGFTELDLGDGKTGIIMTELTVNFLKEINPFEEIVIETSIDEISETGFRIFHRLRREGTTCALAETGFLFFNYRIRKVSRVPETFLKTLKEYGCRNKEGSEVSEAGKKHGKTIGQQESFCE